MALMSFFWAPRSPGRNRSPSIICAGPGRYGRIRVWGSVGFIVAVMGTGLGARPRPYRPCSGSVSSRTLGILRARVADAGSVAAWQQVIRRQSASVRQTRVRCAAGHAFAMSVAHGALYIFYSITSDQWLWEYRDRRPVVAGYTGRNRRVHSDGKS